MKIAVSGIGGLGGFFGGLLAKHYENSNDVKIIFLCRGENETVIRQNGLRVNTVKGNFTAYPAFTTSAPGLIGTVDLLICCTKRYDLAENMRECSSCIDDNTIILPLLNGVDNREFIATIFPDHLVLDGCAYLVARLTEPGVVTESGNISKLFFGSQQNNDPRQKNILDIFLKAGIDATLTDTIQQVIWEKYAFISPIATLTSYLDCSIGDIVSDMDKKEYLKSLLSELNSVATKKRISLPENIYQLTIDKMASLPKDSTSSMHSDFKKGKPTELESLTGYILRAAREYNLQSPVYAMMYDALVKR